MNWSSESVFRNAINACFSSLAPGTYTFQAAASLDGTDWQQGSEAITFVITPPFWKRTSFIIAAVVAFVGLGYYLFKARIQTIQQRQARLFALQDKAGKLEKEKTLVMFESLKQQLNPHFLFNSLASLESLIWEDSGKASQFLEGLSWTYRYILKNQHNELVTLADELEFATEYVNIQKTRFRDTLQVNFCVDKTILTSMIAPVTIQNQIENAIKHNAMSADQPLVVDIFEENGYLVVRNNLQKKTYVETSNRQGLKHLISLYSYLSANPVLMTEGENYFTIRVPLINLPIRSNIIPGK